MARAPGAQVYGLMLRALSAAFPEGGLRLRVPPELALTGEGLRCETLPKAVLGVCDAQALLKAVGLTGFAVELRDPVVPGNAGVFDGSGRPSGMAPAVTLEAGRLAQWALGYRSVAELSAEGAVTVHDAQGALLMDAAPKRHCFIVDEY